MRIACVAAALWLVSSAAAQTLKAPKVTTSASVDCSSLDSIVRGVVKPGMSDQQKLLAVYHWFRRTVYHYRMMGDDRRDALRTINSYGAALCGSQAAVFRQLCLAAGFQARVVSGDGGNELGHTALEVGYGGRWHLIDTMTAFYVLTRGASPEIASMADLAADPTLVSAAEEEGRCGPEFLYCRTHKDTDLALRHTVEANGMREDIAWTLFTIVPDEFGRPRDIRTFWMRGPRRATYCSPEDAYGARVEPLPELTLKPHEEYVRIWDNVGLWMKTGNFDNIGPYHTCGRADEFDPVNFPYYEPYRKPKVGYAPYAYRYYANGWLDWQPHGNEILLGSSPENLRCKRSGALTPADRGRAGTLTIPVQAPYAVVDAALDLEIEAAGPHPRVAVKCADRSETLSPGRHTVSCNPGRNQAAGVFDYAVRIEVREASITVRRLKTTFMLNMYSLPFLAPGVNTVNVSAKQPGKLVVAYEWDGGADNRTVSLPASYTVNVAGGHMPRMKRLTLSLSPVQVHLPAKVVRGGLVDR